MAIAHSLDAVIAAVQAIIDGREIPDEWKSDPNSELSLSLFDILQQAKEDQMNREEFEALSKEEKTRVLAEQLAKLSTKQADTTPIETALVQLADKVAAVTAQIAEVSERVAMIEVAILSAKGAP